MVPFTKQQDGNYLRNVLTSTAAKWAMPKSPEVSFLVWVFMTGHKLPAKFVIHTVGPIGEKKKKLESCYRRIFALTGEYELRSVVKSFTLLWPKRHFVASPLGFMASQKNPPHTLLSRLRASGWKRTTITRKSIESSFACSWQRNLPSTRKSCRDIFLRNCN